ncbi:MAG: DUF2911 domain-containing protein [Bacteroidetes bacterium]|nr:DUF2911 domain-containing protein [Bacteroidota bacterium]
MRVHKALLSLFAILLSVTVSYAQPSHPKSPHDTVKTKDLTITYGRPYKKGREIFGSLVPYGKTYRCGADEPTMVTFAKDATFGGKPVKAGTYSLFAVPTEKSWTVILNSELKMWGTDHDKHADKDVLKVDVPVETLGTPVEQWTITPSNKGITMEWDKTKVMVPVKF